MQSFGHAPDEARVAETYKLLRTRSIEMWGEDRTEEMEDTLRRTASAVARMRDITFDTSEHPGFFLNEFVPKPDENATP